MYPEILVAMVQIAREVTNMRTGGALDERVKKGRWDIVTEADRLSESALMNYITSRFPKDGIRGEEGAAFASNSGFEWAIDPIDGTVNFASGLPFYGISAGRTEKGQSTFGTVLFPDLGVCIFGRRGQGAYRQAVNFRLLENGIFGQAAPINVPESTTDLEKAVVTLGATAGNEDSFQTLRLRCRNVLVFGCFTYEAMLVITGLISACVHTAATPFDVAAVAIIAEEAGCVVERLDGEEMDLRADKIPVIIAANQPICNSIIRAMNQT